MHSGSVARIHLNRMKQNLTWLQSRSGTDKVIAVIKANAYGHGDVEVGRYLEPHVHSFAVATVGEGVHLREARSEEHTSELQSRGHLVCRLLLEKKKKKQVRVRQNEKSPKIKSYAISKN